MLTGHQDQQLFGELSDPTTNKIKNFRRVIMKKYTTLIMPL